MTIKSPITIFPAHLKWPEAVFDTDSVSGQETRVRLVAGAKGIDKLSRFQQLRDLWCFDINSAGLEGICSGASLEHLYIENLKSGQISAFQQLTFLRVLSIERCSQVDSLSEFALLPELRGLGITHFKNVHELSPLSKLTNLEELAVAGGMWTRMKIESLQPLSALRDLKFLHLSNLKVADESLGPLAELNQLERLDLANFYPMEEFAWLSAKLPHTECSWFRPFIDFPFPCPRCNEKELVLLTGKGKPKLCKTCDRKRLAEHVANFQEIAANAV